MNRKLKVGIDLFLALKLYHLPESLLKGLKAQFSDVEFVPVNVPFAQETPDDIQIYWGNRITVDIIDHCPDLQWIHFGSVGVNRARTSSVIDRKITVTNSQGLVIAPMVASALAFMTGLARGVHHCFPLKQSKTLTRENFDRYFYEVQELEGQNCLIVGLGDVGQKLARVCHALDMKVTGIRQSVDKKVKGVGRICSLDSLKECVSGADYIVNILPLTEKTEAAFNKEIFKAMKKSAFFINIGRGETVDEEELIAALREKRIAGAGLDVFSVEPLAADSLLFEMENVMLSPHVAGLSSEYWQRQVELFSGNLQRFIENDVDNMVNKVDMNQAL